MLCGNSLTEVHTTLTYIPWSTQPKTKQKKKKKKKKKKKEKKKKKKKKERKGKVKRRCFDSQRYHEFMRGTSYIWELMFPVLRKTPTAFHRRMEELATKIKEVCLKKEEHEKKKKSPSN